jgi:hypothetical protein
MACCGHVDVGRTVFAQHTEHLEVLQTVLHAGMRVRDQPGIGDPEPARPAMHLVEKTTLSWRSASPCTCVKSWRRRYDSMNSRLARIRRGEWPQCTEKF